MAKDYVIQIDGVYSISGTRISLDSIVYLYREGASAESIVESYPVLNPEQVHGAIAFYLANRSGIDAYLQEGQRTADAQHEHSRHANAELIAKLRRLRHESQIPG